MLNLKIDPSNYSFQKVSIYGTALTLSDKEFNVSGKQLYVHKLQMVDQSTAETDAASLITIKFNDVNNPEIPLREGMIITVDFNRIFINSRGTSGGEGNHYNFVTGDILFFAMKGIELSERVDDVGGKRCQTFPASLDINVKGQPIGVYFETGGVIEFFDHVGNQHTVTVAQYSYLPIAPKKIGSATTATGICIFKE